MDYSDKYNLRNIRVWNLYFITFLYTDIEYEGTFNEVVPGGSDFEAKTNLNKANKGQIKITDCVKLIDGSAVW